MTASYFQETPARGPWSGQEPESEARRPDREPVFNAPWPAIALVVVIVGGYALQSRLSDEFVIAGYAFSPAALLQHRWATLVTALFLHGNWGHALMNAAFALAFATPVARFFGVRLAGAALFFSFYLVCGVLSNLGYAAVHWGSAAALVGASGALSGLMGAAARLIAGGGRLGRIFSSPVIGMGAAWVIVNLLIGALGGAFVPGTGGAGIAWEAHIAGFLAGVLLIGPFARIGRRA
ncbi:MAG TPA: rhomboid family intramembrane serine protease [Caulobacteraceae bacterium]|uniref:rhomboid family intramembrane serine protease n=1 Tax=Phenylobacterium sp. TaxID=1871053 RepID=UPI00262B5B37|nr:rhomboid family intramembrane serine protease [Phenylobacterium sp.]HET9161524.1 rhomboid family intramembrane serine protease [Caulobacteraceae bacterium]